MKGEPLRPQPKPAKRLHALRDARKRTRALTWAQVKALAWRRAKGRCEDCGVVLKRTLDTYPTDPQRGEVHHLVPKSLGGTDEVSNALVVCFICHYNGASGAHRGRG